MRFVESGSVWSTPLPTLRHCWAARSPSIPWVLSSRNAKNAEGDVIGVKERLILDARRSRTNAAARARQRILLPMLLDAVRNLLRHGARAIRRRRKMTKTCSWLVLDYEDAYYIIPLHPSERRFHCARYGNNVIIFFAPDRGRRLRHSLGDTCLRSSAG